MLRIIDSAWGFCDNAYYKVRCTGTAIWVFDYEGNLLKKFSDITYAYKAKFKPGENTIVVKSTAGLLVIKIKMKK